jgi:hypothetical protein
MSKYNIEMKLETVVSFLLGLLLAYLFYHVVSQRRCIVLDSKKAVDLFNKVHKGHDGKCFKLVLDENKNKCNSL